MFQFPGFASSPYGFRTGYPLAKVGFPIRKSAGHRLFAPHRSLSQRTTSFIASYRQGIHQMPLGHLIALISNAQLNRNTPYLRGASASARWSLPERPEVFGINPSYCHQVTAQAYPLFTM